VRANRDRLLDDELDADELAERQTLHGVFNRACAELSALPEPLATVAGAALGETLLALNPTHHPVLSGDMEEPSSAYSREWQVAVGAPAQQLARETLRRAVRWWHHTHDGSGCLPVLPELPPGWLSSMLLDALLHRHELRSENSLPTFRQPASAN
jgi:hypothetical protein